MLHKATVRPVRLRRHDPGLSVTVLYGIGYRAECECGARSPIRATFRGARSWVVEHRAEVGAASHNDGAA